MKKFLVAFDINGTLVRRLHKTNTHIKTLASMDVFYDFRYGDFFVYNRPYLDILIKFLESHNASYVLWTTGVTDRLSEVIRYLKFIGFDKNLAQYYLESCKVGKTKVECSADLRLWVKDLRVVSRDHGVDIKNCILVDDSVDKSVHDQNFICCPLFVPGEEDTGIIQICKHLDDFFECKEDCIAKSLRTKT